jgi:dihydropyrimidinase
LSLFTPKGAILAGSYADIVVWDPKLSKMISAASQKCIIDCNVLEGFRVSGQARHTISRGEVASTHCKKDQARSGRGKLIQRKPFAAINQGLSVWKELTAPRAISR